MRKRACEWGKEGVAVGVRGCWGEECGVDGVSRAYLRPPFEKIHKNI